MIREAIEQLVAGHSLTADEAAQVMTEIMQGEATPAQFGAFVTALRLKGETAEEIAGMARVMREKALHVQVEGPLVDTCGTGGDGQGTFNISTAAALVAAGGGLRIAKHGNRAMSGACGSADVLETLGVKIDLGPEGVQRCIEEAGMGFMFAQVFHPAMRHAAGPRREIGIRTVFNVLGPLTNPAGAQAQVLGVADAALGPKMAQVLHLLGARHALVVHGNDGVDELTLGAPTQVWEVRGAETRTYAVQGKELGLPLIPKERLRVGSREESASLLRSVLSGEKGPARDVVLLNAAAAFVVADRAPSLREALPLAQEAIDSGKALGALNKLIEVSQKVAH